MRQLLIFLLLSLLTVVQFTELTVALGQQKSYANSVKTIKDQLIRLNAEYRELKDLKDTNNMIERVRPVFVKSVIDLVPYWLGTQWTFNGTSQIPQEGSIACGYFVTTLLEDIGLKVQRAKLAQQTSENIIKSLSSEKHITRYSNKNLNDFVTSVSQQGEGLYIVGLDFHVGFLWHDGATVHFIHSTFVYPGGVIHELASESPVLAASNYRVVGKISEEDALIEKWLMREKVHTVGRH